MDASALASGTRVHGWNMSGLRLLAMLVALGVTWATMAPTVALGQPGCGCGGGGRRPYGDYCPRNGGVTEDALCRATLRPGEDPGMGQGWLRPRERFTMHLRVRGWSSEARDTPRPSAGALRRSMRRHANHPPGKLSTRMSWAKIVHLDLSDRLRMPENPQAERRARHVRTAHGDVLNKQSKKHLAVAVSGGPRPP